MKLIIKKSEPKEFTKWKSVKRRLKNPKWKKLNNPTKNIVRNALIAEQGYVCCYCGIRINQDNHIDHIVPRSADPLIMFEWDNILVSCQRDPKPPEPRHCGWARGNTLLKISPLDSDCESRFRYTANGKILPDRIDGKDDNAATEVIDNLNLNNMKLKNLREGAIDAALEGIKSLNKSQISRLIESYRAKDKRGRFAEFCMAAIYILTSYNKTTLEL